MHDEVACEIETPLIEMQMHPKSWAAFIAALNPKYLSSYLPTGVLGLRHLHFIAYIILDCT